MFGERTDRKGQQHPWQREGIGWGSLTHSVVLVLQGPWPLMTEGYAKYGEVFTVPVAHKRITFLIGPDVAPHFFNASDDKMSQTEV